jgi:hypothetical protein
MECVANALKKTIKLLVMIKKYIFYWRWFNIYSFSKSFVKWISGISST